MKDKQSARQRILAADGRRIKKDLIPCPTACDVYLAHFLSEYDYCRTIAQGNPRYSRCPQREEAEKLQSLLQGLKQEQHIGRRFTCLWVVTPETHGKIQKLGKAYAEGGSIALVLDLEKVAKGSLVLYNCDVKNGLDNPERVRAFEYDGRPGICNFIDIELARIATASERGVFAPEARLYAPMTSSNIAKTLNCPIETCDEVNRAVEGLLNQRPPVDYRESRAGTRARTASPESGQPGGG